MTRLHRQARGSESKATLLRTGGEHDGQEGIGHGLDGGTASVTAASRGTGWFAAPNEVFDRDDLSAFERLVFLYLCRCLGPDGRAWPSYQRIAASCGISRRAAIDAVRGLVDKGLITVQSRRDAAGDPATNVYQLRVGRGGATSAPPGAREERGGASDAPGSAGHAPPSAPDAPGVVQEVHLKDTH